MIRQNNQGIFAYLEDLFSTHISGVKRLWFVAKENVSNVIDEEEHSMSLEEKSEMSIAAWLLPEKYKLTDCYMSLPSKMTEKKKALAVKWLLEGKFGYIDTRGNIPLLNEKISIPSIYGPIVYKIIRQYHPILGKKEQYCLTIILYEIYDVFEGRYEDVVYHMRKQHKRIFSDRRKAEAIIQQLIDKGIVRCKIRFIESRKKILKPRKVLSCSIDLEYEVMNTLDKLDEPDYIIQHISDDD